MEKFKKTFLLTIYILLFPRTLDWLFIILLAITGSSLVVEPLRVAFPNAFALILIGSLAPIIGASYLLSGLADRRAGKFWAAIQYLTDARFCPARGFLLVILIQYTLSWRHGFISLGLLFCLWILSYKLEYWLQTKLEKLGVIVQP